MKKYLNIYLIGVATTFVVAVVSNGGKFVYDTGFAFGVLNLLLGAGLIVASFIASVSGSRETGRALIAAAGLILLTGGITCSIFPIRLNH